MPGLGSGGRMFESYHSEEEKREKGKRKRLKERKKKREGEKKEVAPTREPGIGRKLV